MAEPFIGTTAPHIDMIPRPRPPRFRILGFFAGTAIAIALVALFNLGGPGSLQSHVNALLLPADLKGAAFLYSDNNVSTLYLRQQTGFEKITLGTTLTPLFVARQRLRYVSIDRDPATQVYEIRENGSTVYTSPTSKLGAALSPNGGWVAFTELPILNRGASTTPIASTTVSIVAKDGTGYRTIGPGFSPFFVSDTILVFFSDSGLVTYDLAARHATFIDANVRAPNLPYPAPTQSPDGTLIAWTSPGDRKVMVKRLSENGTVNDFLTFSDVKSPTIALANDALFMIERSQTGTRLWRYELTKDATPVEVTSLPEFGILITLIP